MANYYASKDAGLAAGAGQGWVSAAVQRLRAWRARFALEAILSGLEDHQLDDLGITRAEIPAYARASPFALRLLNAMLARLEIAPEWVRPRSHAHDELLRACRVCPNVAVCRRWLATCTPPDGYRAFCPNATLLDKLARTSGGRHASDPLRQRNMARTAIATEPRK